MERHLLHGQRPTGRFPSRPSLLATTQSVKETTTATLLHCVDRFELLGVNPCMFIWRSRSSKNGTAPASKGICPGQQARQRSDQRHHPGFPCAWGTRVISLSNTAGLTILRKSLARNNIHIYWGSPSGSHHGLPSFFGRQPRRRAICCPGALETPSSAACVSPVSVQKGNRGGPEPYPSSLAWNIQERLAIVSWLSTRKVKVEAWPGNITSTSSR